MSRPPIRVEQVAKIQADTCPPKSTAIEVARVAPGIFQKSAKQRFSSIAKGIETRRALTKGDGELLVPLSVTWERLEKAMDHVMNQPHGRNHRIRFPISFAPI